jgi:hypothetical protein
MLHKVFIRAMCLAAGCLLVLQVSGCTSAPPGPTENPVAVAGTNQQVPVFTAVTLDGTASFDPQGSPLTYRWTQILGPPVHLVNADQPVASFIATSTGGLVFQLTVENQSGGTATDTVTVDVF